jgi:hypothetical protein
MRSSGCRVSDAVPGLSAYLAGALSTPQVSYSWLVTKSAPWLTAVLATAISIVPASRSMPSINRFSVKPSPHLTQNQDVEHNSCRQASKALACIGVISNFCSVDMQFVPVVAWLLFGRPASHWRPKQGMRKQVNVTAPLEAGKPRADRRVHKDLPLHDCVFPCDLDGWNLIFSFAALACSFCRLPQLVRGAVDDCRRKLANTLRINQLIIMFSDPLRCP